MAWSATPTLTGTPIGALRWTLEGDDAGDFDDRVPTTGVVSMVARDYEDPQDTGTNNVYAVTVKATDADGNAAEVSFTVTVRNTAESATLTVGGLSNAGVDENAPWTATPTLSGTPVGAVTWTLAGDDAGDFTIVPTTGVVSMVARDYEDPRTRAGTTSTR